MVERSPEVTRGRKFPKNYMSIFTARSQILYQNDPLFISILKLVVEKPPEVTRVQKFQKKYNFDFNIKQTRS